MSTRLRPLTKTDLAQAFAAESGLNVSPILSTKDLALLLSLSPKTIYEWIAKGRLDGAFRKRGKHMLFWRDRVLDVLFNGPEWK